MPRDSQQPSYGLKTFKGLGVVPVTKHLLQLGCFAHALYVMNLEKEQKEKEEAWKHLNLQKEGAPQRKQATQACCSKGRLADQAKRSSLKGKKQFSKIAWKLEKQF